MKWNSELFEILSWIVTVRDGWKPCCWRRKLPSETLKRAVLLNTQCMPEPECGVDSEKQEVWGGDRVYLSRELLSQNLFYIL